MTPPSSSVPNSHFINFTVGSYFYDDIAPIFLNNVENHSKIRLEKRIHEKPFNKPL